MFNHPIRRLLVPGVALAAALIALSPVTRTARPTRRSPTACSPRHCAPTRPRRSRRSRCPATPPWNEDDGSYQLKNAGTGLCADVAYSSKTSGDPVVEYTCTGTPNQRWVIAADGASLKFSARHSGLSLAAGANGLVVQQTDTAAASQRWRATPN